MFAGSRLLLPVLTNFVTLVAKPRRKEGHAVREPSLLRGIAVLRRSGSRKKRRPPVAARSGGAGAKEEQVGRKARCHAPGSRRGGCRPRGSGGVGAEACCCPPCLGRSRERGTQCRLPSTGGAIAVDQEAEEHRAVHQRCPVPSHGTASEPLSWLRTKQQCVREPDRDFFFFFFTFNNFNNKINKHKWKAAAPHGRLPHTKHKLKSRPGPLSSSTVVTPHLTLPKLLRGTRDWWVVQVSFITIYSTGLALFPRLSAPPHSPHSVIKKNKEKQAVRKQIKSASDRGSNVCLFFK